jgi:hypothetical protein
MTAVVGTAFDATVSKEVRRRLVNAKALADIVLVPTPGANDVALQVVVREPVGPSCPRGVDASVLDPALAEAVARPFESFSSEEQAEMLKRLDYEGLSTPSPTLIPN